MRVKKMKTVQAVSARLSERELGEAEKLVKMGYYLNISDFIRAAVREKIETIKVLPARQTTVAVAKREIIDFLKKAPETYPSDIAAQLGLDLEITFQAVSELEKEGRIG